jgi:hypothetical protein
MARDQDTERRHSSHQTQWAAQFAVASELCKRSYEVALTLGNHPDVDLMVISPNGRQFLVDVKGQYKRNFWPVRKKERRGNLFYVLALVPRGESNRFFILTQDQANNGIADDLMHAKARRKAKGLEGEPRDFPGIEWKFAEQFADKWKVLPK